MIQHEWNGQLLTRFVVTHMQGESIAWAKDEVDATTKAERRGLRVLFVMPSERSMIDDHARLIPSTQKEPHR